MAILDNRTSLDTWESNQPDDLTGAAGGTADAVIFIEGTQSYGYYSGSTRDGLLYDHGSAISRAGQTCYFWVNCGIVGLLDTVANGGLAARFCGATVTDWFEVNLAGSDSWPAAVSGGWTMFVVDVDKAKTSSIRTNGTPPATSVIRYMGISTITPTMPRMVDNTWFDACWALPAATPGILVEGTNGGPDWTWADIVAASVSGSWGTAADAAGGAVAINTPIRFGDSDAVTHGFSDTNVTILWEDWDVATDFYGLEVIGGSGAQSFALGIKTGTGDDATGAQGCVIQASPTGERWYFDCDDASVDVCNIYGCSFLHGSDFQLDDAEVSVISTQFLDCSSATVSNAGDFLKCSIIDANTADSIAFLFTDDITDVVRCNFEFSDGHAIGLISGGPVSQTSKGNLFAGYGGTAGSNLNAGPNGSTDAAISNDNGSATDITITDSGDSPSVRNETGTPSTTVIAGAVTTLIVVKDNTTALLENARVIVEASDGTGPLPYRDTVTITAVAAVASVSHTGHGMVSGTKVVIRGVEQDPYNGVFAISNVTVNAYDYTMTQGSPTSPAVLRTGAANITSTGCVLEGLTDVNGEISNSMVLSTNQPVAGRIRKMTSSPYFKAKDFTDVVSSTDGLSKSEQLILDE